MKAALLAISTYQRYVSPYKGFCCAYRVHTGHQSCSVLGYRAIRRYGLWRGLVVLNRRFERCGVAYRRYGASSPSRGALQRRFCDVGCPCDIVSCDITSIDCVHGVFDAANCCSGCDCGSCNWRSPRGHGDEEKYVYIPPQRWPDRRQRAAL